MKYEVIPVNESIKAGEIRVEADSSEDVTVCRYFRDFDANCHVLIAILDIDYYMMWGKDKFLAAIEKEIKKAGLKPKNVRITNKVMSLFDSE